MAGSMIDINGSGFKGYLAKPDSGKGQGILLIQEIFGVNSHIRSVADLYAKLGYVTLAPDVFWRSKPGVELGYTQDDITEGFGYAQKLDPKQTVDDFKAAIDKLKSQPECKGKVAAVGYCMGGRFSYVLAGNKLVDAAVCYYGGGIAGQLDIAGNIACPVLMHFGAKDMHIPMTDVDKIKDALKGKANTEVLVYDADHGFNCDARGSYDRASAMLAFGRSAIMLNKALS